MQPDSDGPERSHASEAERGMPWIVTKRLEATIRQLLNLIGEEPVVVPELG
jgi:hypothetical protein